MRLYWSCLGTLEYSERLQFNCGNLDEVLAQLRCLAICRSVRASSRDVHYSSLIMAVFTAPFVSLVLHLHNSSAILLQHFHPNPLLFIKHKQHTQQVCNCNWIGFVGNTVRATKAPFHLLCSTSFTSYWKSGSPYLVKNTATDFNILSMKLHGYANKDACPWLTEMKVHCYIHKGTSP